MRDQWLTELDTCFDTRASIPILYSVRWQQGDAISYICLSAIGLHGRAHGWRAVYDIWDPGFEESLNLYTGPSLLRLLLAANRFMDELEQAGWEAHQWTEESEILFNLQAQRFTLYLLEQAVSAYLATGPR